MPRLTRTARPSLLRLEDRDCPAVFSRFTPATGHLAVWFNNDPGTAQSVWVGQQNGLVAVSANGAYRATPVAGRFVRAAQVRSVTVTGSARDNRIDLRAVTQAAFPALGGPVTLRGAGGNDWLIGSSFADTIQAGHLDDYVEGGPGGDAIHVLGGNDFVKGGAGDDRLYGGAGDDHLDGGAGDDAIDGGAGVDALFGRAGLDTLLFGERGEREVSAGQNLIVNPGAEAGDGSPNGSTVAAVPGWTTEGTFTVVRYDNASGFPLPTDPGPADRGRQFFAGGYSAGSRATQRIDLSSFAGPIDAGSQPFLLSGWLGGYANHRDNARLTVTFRGATGEALGTATIGPVTNSDRGNSTSLLQRSTTGTVPAGTRLAEVELRMERLDGSSDDGYADNLVFRLEGMPRPAATFTAPSYRVRENGRVVRIGVQIDLSGLETARIGFATRQLRAGRPGFAAAGRDYVSAQGALTFAAGETGQDFLVSIKDDNLTEGDEQLGLVLFDLDTGEILDEARLLILDTRRPILVIPPPPSKQ